MIKNIPNQITKHTLMEMFNKNFEELFNFFYLPIDKDTKLNMGYAFINFINAKAALAFYDLYQRKSWPKVYKSKKICEIKYGRL